MRQARLSSASHAQRAWPRMRHTPCACARIITTTPRGTRIPRAKVAHLAPHVGSALRCILFASFAQLSLTAAVASWRASQAGTRVLSRRLHGKPVPQCRARLPRSARQHRRVPDRHDGRRWRSVLPWVHRVNAPWSSSSGGQRPHAPRHIVQAQHDCSVRDNVHVSSCNGPRCLKCIVDTEPALRSGFVIPELPGLDKEQSVRDGETQFVSVHRCGAHAV